MDVAAKNKRSAAPDSAQLLSKMFADVFQSFMECSDEVQAAVRERVRIVNAPDATEEEREGALETIAEALFPAEHERVMGVDFDGEYAAGAPPEIQRILQQMDEEQRSFGERVQAILEAQGQTQADLASAIGVGQPAVSMIISRDCRPQKRTVEKIAAALRVSPEDLWPGLKAD